MKKGLANTDKKADAASTASGGENTVINKAAEGKTRDRALARQLRKAGQIASLSAEVSSAIEDFAGLTDRIKKSLDTGRKALDSMKTEIRSAGHLSETLDESSGEMYRDVSEIFASVDFLGRFFEEDSGFLSDIIDEINGAAQAQSSTQKRLENLAKLEDKASGIIEDITGIAGLLDVAGLNASLEADRSGGHSGEFTVITGRIRQASAVCEKNAEESGVFFGDLKTDVQELAEKQKGLGDRIRTILVMVKGVRNAYSDVRTELTELAGLSGTVTDNALDSFADDESALPCNGPVLDTIDRAAGLTDVAITAFEIRENAFAPALEQAGKISAAVSQLAAGENIPDLLDEIMNIADDFMGVTEDTGDELQSADDKLAEAASEMESMERIVENTGERLGIMARNAADILDASGKIRKKLEELRGTIGESKTALKGITGEIGLLHEDTRTFIRDMQAFDRKAQSILRIANAWAVCAARLDSISLHSALEVTRAGQHGSGFASIPGHLDAIAVRIAGTVKTLEEYSDSLRHETLGIISSGDDVRWRDSADAMTGILEEISETSDSDVPAVLEKASATVTAAQKLVKLIDKSRDSMKDITVSVESAVSMVQDAAGLAQEQMQILERAFEAGEKLLARADELYPDVEE
ncbi:methyl-accepting chemotaxis protein [bacterium]|nr:methyl-accepting chemotaxis protein [bacterium]